MCSEAIDIWSIGCILGELIHRKPLFPGKSHAHQVQLIFEVKGYTGPQQDLGFPLSAEALQFLEKRCKGPGKPLTSIVPNAIPSALQLLEALLQTSPANRPSAAQALQFAYLSDAQTTCDYTNVKLEPPAKSYFDFENHKYSLQQLCTLIRQEVADSQGIPFAEFVIRNNIMNEPTVDYESVMGRGGAVPNSGRAPAADLSVPNTARSVVNGRSAVEDGPASQLPTKVRDGGGKKLSDGPANNTTEVDYRIGGGIAGPSGAALEGDETVRRQRKEADPTKANKGGAAWFPDVSSQQPPVAAAAPAAAASYGAGVKNSIMSMLGGQKQAPTAKAAGTLQRQSSSSTELSRANPQAAPGNASMLTRFQNRYQRSSGASEDGSTTNAVTNSKSTAALMSGNISTGVTVNDLNHGMNKLMTKLPALGNR